MGDAPNPQRARRSDRTPRQRRRQQRGKDGAPRPRGDAPAPAAASSRVDTRPRDDEVASPAGPDRERRAVGRRRVASRQRRRRSRTVVTVAIVLLAVIAVGVVAVVSGLADRAIELVTPDPTGDAVVATPDDLQPSVVLVTYDGDDPSGQATGLVVLALERETGRGTALLVPVATMADIPGYGQFELADAYAFGQGPLVWVTLDNLIGTRFDGVAALSQQDWAALFTEVGGLTVDVRTRLVDRTDDGGQTVRFEPGTQHLDGPQVADYLTFRGDAETELEALPRVQQVVIGLLDRLAEEPDLLDALVADDAALIDTTDAALVHTVLGELAEARARDQVTAITLPVTPLGTGRDDAYRADASRVQQLVDDRFAASRLSERVGGGRPVQILNGSGVPGIGQPVAERLTEGGYRVVLTGNADRFDYEATRIIVYDESDDVLALAEDIRERLGVGTVERSATPQSVVDVTVVVGHDFER